MDMPKRWIFARYGRRLALYHRGEFVWQAILDLLPFLHGTWALGVWFDPDDEDGQRVFQWGVVVLGGTISWEPDGPGAVTRWRGWREDRRGRRVVRSAEKALRRAAREPRDFEEQAGAGGW